MNCRNCNAPLLDGSAFCIKCGTPVDGTTKKPKSKKAKKRKKGLGIIVFLILFLLIGACGVAAFLMFPTKISIETAAALTSDNGKFDKMVFSIHSNQPISEVTVLIGEKEAKGSAEIENFDATFTCKRFEIPEGETDVTVTVKTWFGKKEQVFTLSYVYDGLRNDIGYVGIPEPDSFEEINDGRNLVTNELIVIFKDTATKDQINALVQDYEAEVVGQLYVMNQYQLRFTGYGSSYIHGLYDTLLNEEIVEDVFFNTTLDSDISITPNDPDFDSWNVNSPSGNNWWLECVNAPGAWDYNGQLSSIRVGVLDSSLDFDHEDLKINSNRVSIISSPDFTTLKQLHDYFNETSDTHVCVQYCPYCSYKNHGTHCAGIIGALENNNKGIAGVNWNSELYFSTWWYYLKENNGSPQLGIYGDINASYMQIAKLVMSGCRVVSMSLGSSTASSPDRYEASDIRYFERLLKTLEDGGYDFVICKAAGNSDDDASKYALNRIMTGSETARNHVIIVGAVENTLSENGNNASAQYNLAYYSNYGDLIDICAPGSDVYSTVHGNQYQNMSGTSMATPLVAGITSMVYGANPDLNYQQVKDIIKNSYTQFAYKNRELYGIINARMAVEKALKINTTTPPQKPDIGFISGLVQDAVTLDSIQQGSIMITNNTTSESSLINIRYGKYETYLDAGTYTMVFQADGYHNETIYNVEITSGVMSYNVLLNMVEEQEENGIVSGRIIDAFDASSIPNATIRFYAGINNTSSDHVLTIYSDNSGYYSATLSPGNYTIQVEADGYTTGTAQVVCIPGQTNNQQNCTLTPILENGEIRIVLTWGEYPSDLDSHLVGPSAGGGTFHVFFSDKNHRYNSTLYVNLDVDDTTSYGPETTSVYQDVDGTYTFYVHNYSDRYSSSSNNMATSGAQIKLYLPGRSDPYIFNVPNEAGTLWTVFSITDGIVTPINSMSYESDPDYVGY